MNTIHAKTYLSPAQNKALGEMFSSDPSIAVFNTPEYTVFPGFCDVHVHFREPGFSYKETIRTGSMAAARGGFTEVCAMPNLNPVPDSPAHLREETELIARDAVIGVYPYGAITVGQKGEQLADLAGMAPDVIAFSDDGHGVQSADMMREAMRQAKALNRLVVAHCEVNELLRGGYIHDGRYAAEHGHRGICSESEYAQIARDAELSEETGCPYHVCHISTKESVEIIRRAKARGVNITCETGPHYLLLDENDLQELGRFKMNPPLRAAEDRLALIEGLKDGTVDMIITDHAPHSAEEKSRGLEKSAFGVVGIETVFPLMYTGFVKTGILTMEKLLDLMVYQPAARFGLPLETGFSVWKLGEEYAIDPAEFLSMGKATPFEGRKVFGRNYLTVYRGREVYRYGGEA